MAKPKKGVNPFAKKGDSEKGPGETKPGGPPEEFPEQLAGGINANTKAKTSQAKSAKGKPPWVK